MTVTRLTPRIGTEISGLQLSQLSDVQKNELAYLLAKRGVVVFRDQDFKDIGAEKQKAFGEYFGKLHVHVSRRAGLTAKGSALLMLPSSPSAPT